MQRNEHLLQELKLIGFDGMCTLCTDGGLRISDDRNFAYIPNSAPAIGDTALLSIVETACDNMHKKQFAVLKNNLPRILFQIDPLSFKWLRVLRSLKGVKRNSKVC